MAERGSIYFRAKSMLPWASMSWSTKTSADKFYRKKSGRIEKNRMKSSPGQSNVDIALIGLEEPTPNV
jgi:hypothetical protein